MMMKNNRPPRVKVDLMTFHRDDQMEIIPTTVVNLTLYGMSVKQVQMDLVQTYKREHGTIEGFPNYRIVKVHHLVDKKAA